MATLVPPLGAKGIYSLRAPFVAAVTVVYECAALRTFSEMIAQGDDPLKVIYEPLGLGALEYAADQVAGAVAITLLSIGNKPIYVPSTYVESYPNMGVIPHHWVVATISCGMLPETYDLARIKDAITTAVSDFTGVQADVVMAIAPTSDAITEAQYAQNLAARDAAIRNRSTNYADKLALQAQVEALAEQNSELISIIEALQAP